VFLSSYTISRDLYDIPPSEVIPYIHAQIKLNLDEVYRDEHYIVLRLGGFTTNILRFKAGILASYIRLYGPDFKFDYITPSDIGRVSSTILATSPKNN
jgi:hypothetical protein